VNPSDDRRHIRFMRVALSLARRGLGRVAPNPAVGCVLVNDGRIVGRGWTCDGGRPHAETEALRRAGARARGATAYVTLEPCAHHGETPPCAQALIDAGIAKVVVGAGDPDPRVDGGGIRMLAEAGIEVVSGICEAEACEINAGFLSKVRIGRPLVTLKVASSLDGCIATRTGNSQWITGEAARVEGHLLRAAHDAILVGSGTASEDNPALTCRLPGLENASPIRIVVDGRLSVPLTHNLVKTAGEIPVYWFALTDTVAEYSERATALRDAGVKLFPINPDVSGRADLAAVLRVLGNEGVTRLLVEGGATIASSLLALDLVDRVVWFRAPIVIGGDGLGAIGGFGVDALADSAQFSRTSFRRVENDVIECLERRR